ncbi:murein tripeptide amidase MpaA [Fibrobacterales bacterium]|nr:murein tripeptide amidase MpaA [Fibrobacterales bacterium]
MENISKIIYGVGCDHLIELDSQTQIHRMVKYPFYKLQKEARKEGIDLQILSGYRSFERQMKIWNSKASGQRTLYSKEGNVLEFESLSKEELLWAILEWSALPGCSRHHLGTDLDVYDASVGVSIDDIELVPEEYVKGGPFEKLGSWLNKTLVPENKLNQDFFRPYETYQGGVQVELWHLSYSPLAKPYLSEFDIEELRGLIKQSEIILKEVILKNLEKIVETYVLNICEELKSVAHPLLTQNTLQLDSQSYGVSIDGVTLKYFGANALGRPIDILVLGAIHGDEGDTTLVLSNALRILEQRSLAEDAMQRCAVILCANPDGKLLGTRANALGVDLNRNFPTQNWKRGIVKSRATLEEPRIMNHLSGKTFDGQVDSEPEVGYLISLIKDLNPKEILSLHSPLACVDDPNQTKLGEFLSASMSLERVNDIGYPTPGSMGTWCAENNIPIVTLELPRVSGEEQIQLYAPILADVLLGEY